MSILTKRGPCGGVCYMVGCDVGLKDVPNTPIGLFFAIEGLGEPLLLCPEVF